MSSATSLWLALVAALLLHLGVMLWLPVDTLTRSAPAPGDAENPIEISPLPKKFDRPVVRTSRLEDQEETDKQARFAGEFRNRVRKETQAREKGHFREGSRHAGSPSIPGVGPGVAPPRPGLSNLLPYGANPYSLPDDIAKGDETVLNTDQVAYASFLNRIADEVYDPWVRHVQDALEDRMRSGKRLEEDSYITRIEIVMDDTGKVTAIKLLHGCGFPPFDEAAKRAFWDTEPFPHPPREMLDRQGFVHLTYELSVEWQTGFFHILPKLL